MYEVRLWVPTKGWKVILRCKSEDKAFKTAETFEPLEVQVCYPLSSGVGSVFGGRAHVAASGDPAESITEARTRRNGVTQ